MNNYQFVVITVVNLNYFRIQNYKMVTRKVMVIKVIKFTQKEKITIINILKTSKTKQIMKMVTSLLPTNLVSD